MNRLEARSSTILKVIVSEYIATGEPVGSRTVSRKKEVDLSAATVRNIMSELVETGYISQPHISAGRVPTDKGYRFFVDAMLRAGQLSPQENRPDIEALIREGGVDVRNVLRHSSSVLAELSRKAGVVTGTAPREQTFKSIEFIKVSDDRIVVVLVFSAGYVQNKMIFDEDGLSQENLERYSRMINDMLKDLDLSQARERVEQELLKDKTRMDAMLTKALRLGHIILSQEGTREIYIEGQTNILGEPEFADIEQLRALLVTFEEKSSLLKILDKTLEARGVQIFIGAEHGLSEISTCAIVAYPIRAEETALASISVIGPKRMNYQTVIPLVISTGRVLATVLRSAVETPL